MKYLGIGLCLAVILILIIESRKKRRKVTVSHKDALTDTKRKESGSQQVRIRVQRNQWNQINIVCTNMSDKKMGELLSSYTLSEAKRTGGPSYTVHLENILVGRRYRKKGIGTCMVVYLLQEMLRIEQENGCEFRYIYGEVGRGGDR